jgi:hypothetical protein
VYFFFLFDKGGFDANKLQYEFGSATKLSNKANMLILQSNRVVAEVLIRKNSPTRGINVGTYQQESIGNVVHEISFVKQKMTLIASINLSRVG